MTRIGGLLASRENAAWVLEREGILGVYPEGIHGAFGLLRDAYRISPFFRDDFAALALRHRAPVVPFVTFGSAESSPILGRCYWNWLKRHTQWPYLPITTPLPLPVKWRIEILPPVTPAHLGLAPADAADSQAVQHLATEVRGRLTAALAAGRRRGRRRPEEEEAAR